MTWVFDEIKKGRDRPFCFYRKRSFSYEELALAIEMAEENLQRRGVPAGKIVAIGGDYGLLAVAVLLALYRRGNIAVPLTGDSISETGRRIEAAGAEWFVVVEPCDEKFQTLWQGEREPAPVVRQL